MLSGQRTPRRGCVTCTIGTYSHDGSACLPSDCSPGTIPSWEGAERHDDGCIPCPQGSFSLGGSFTTCEPIDCPPGEVANRIGAVNNLGGCEACPPGTYSPAVKPLNACPPSVHPG